MPARNVTPLDGHVTLPATGQNVMTLLNQERTMKTTFNTLFAALLLAGSASAFAASSVDLSVRGTITPSACEPTLSKGGLVDLGKISAKDLNADRPTSLERQTVQLTLTCDGPTSAAIEAKDNREGSDFNNDLSQFGLGTINVTEKLGAMELRILQPLIADGVQVRSIGSMDGGSNWNVQRMLTRDSIISVADNSTLVPLLFQVLTADIQIQPQIAPTNQLTLTNEVAIDGSVTLSVIYF